MCVCVCIYVYIYIYNNIIYICIFIYIYLYSSAGITTHPKPDGSHAYRSSCVCASCSLGSPHMLSITNMQRQTSPDSTEGRRRDLKVGASFVHSTTTGQLQREAKWKEHLKSFMPLGSAWLQAISIFNGQFSYSLDSCCPLFFHFVEVIDCAAHAIGVWVWSLAVRQVLDMIEKNWLVSLSRFVLMYLSNMYLQAKTFDWVWPWDNQQVL